MKYFQDVWHKTVKEEGKMEQAEVFWAISGSDGLKVERNPELQRLLLDQVRAFDESLLPGEHAARRILGPQQVITRKQAQEAWEVIDDDVSVRLPIESELEECAKLNQAGAKWHLVWVNGLNFRQQQNIKGLIVADMEQKLWWGEEIADFKSDPGYYLVDLWPRWFGKRAYLIRRDIPAFEDSTAFCHPVAFAEIIQTIWMVSGVRLAESWYHSDVQICGALPYDSQLWNDLLLPLAGAETEPSIMEGEEEAYFAVGGFTARGVEIRGVTRLSGWSGGVVVCQKF